MGKLTLRQEKFCLEYAKSGNATEAYKLAGYKVQTEKAAGASAARMLGNVGVKNRIDELRAETINSKIADAQEIQSLLTGAMRTAAQEGDRIGLCKTADILNKMHGTYINKTEITGPGGLPFEGIKVVFSDKP